MIRVRGLAKSYNERSWCGYPSVSERSTDHGVVTQAYPVTGCVPCIVHLSHTDRSSGLEGNEDLETDTERHGSKERGEGGERERERERGRQTDGRLHR